MRTHLGLKLLQAQRLGAATAVSTQQGREVPAQYLCAAAGGKERRAWRRCQVRLPLLAAVAANAAVAAGVQHGALCSAAVAPGVQCIGRGCHQYITGRSAPSNRYHGRRQRPELAQLDPLAI